MMNAASESGRLELRLLGTFDVRVAGQSLSALRARKEQWLLALLALRHDRDVSRNWLAATLWPDNDETQALFYLRKALSSLRHTLAEEAIRLESPSKSTVHLNLSGAFCDVLAFDAATTRPPTTPAQEERLHEALALYRGPLLQECTEEWIAVEREARRQAYLAALEWAGERALSRGEAAAACRWFRLALAADPYRESAACALMQALADSGDRAALKQVYQELRLRLHDDLNTSPAPETESLFQKLSRQEAQTSPPSPPAPAASSALSLRHLPVPLTDLIGREADIRAAGERLSQQRLLTLLGPGGVGKTRLAIAVAEVALPCFSEGVWFADLAALTEGSFVAATVARTLGLKPEAGRSDEECLTEQLSSRCLLLVLDNCEHLIDSCATLADRLLAACPELRILATSRQALGVTGEQTYLVSPLAIPAPEEVEGQNGLLATEKEPGILREYAGIELFVQRTLLVNPAFRLNRRNAAAVCQICRSLDGIPLAIELAAARMRSLTAEDISGRLHHRFRLLTGGSRSALPRQQTLRALIDWSYDLLGDAEKAMLCRVSVFSGGWTLDAAEAVCPGDPFDAEESFDLLSSLVDKNLVVAETRGEVARFHLLETVLEYASDRLREGENGEAALEALHSRHRDYFLDRAEEAAKHLNGSEAQVWLERLERERENFRLVLATGAGERELRLAAFLYRFWVMRGYVAEGRAHCAALIRQQADDGASSALADLLNVSGNMAFIQSDYAAARRFYEQSAVMKNRLGDYTGEAGTLINLASVLREEGDLVAARAQFERSLSIHQKAGNTRPVCICLTCLGNLCAAMGEPAAAPAYFKEAIQLYRELDDRAGEALALHNLADCYQKSGETAKARSAFEESLAANREMGNTLDAALNLMGLGIVSRTEGKLSEAERYFAEALPTMIAIGAQRYISLCFIGWAQNEALREAPERAARLLGAAEKAQEGNTARRATEREEAQAMAAELRGKLGDARFDAEFAHGYALTREDAAAMAMEGR